MDIQRALVCKLCTLVLPAFMAGALLVTPVRAQDAPAAEPTATDTAAPAVAEPTKPISLDLINVPIQAALRTLFNSAGIRNYTIDSDVQGFANINVSEVPFSLALRQMLSSVTPPLSYGVENGVYHVKVQRDTPAPAPTISAPATTTADGSTDTSSGTSDEAYGYVPIGINHYDAYYIARLLGAKGIVQVGTNDVVGASMSGGGGLINGLGGNGGSAFGGGSSYGGGFGGSGLSSPVTSIGGNSAYGGGGFGNSAYGNSGFGNSGSGSRFGGGGYGGGGYRGY